MASKNKKSAFYWFMQEILEKSKQEGKPIQGGMAKVADLAHPRWNAMTPAQKEPYEQKARGFKSSLARLDNQLNPIHLRVDPLLEYELARAREIDSVVALWPADLHGVSAVRFCCIDFQILGKVELEKGSPPVYLPAEVAICEFSLQDGITDTFHGFLRPPPIPTGGRYVCQSHSLNTHHIPLDGHRDATDDYAQLYARIMSFLRVDRPDSVANHFYVPMANYDSCVYCLRWLHDQAYADTEEESLKPYELEGLLQALTLRSTNKIISKKGATDILNTSAFNYIQGTKCSYHDDLECIHCSLAFTRQYCYSIFDFLKDSYQIRMTSRHNPAHSDDEGSSAVVPALSRPPSTSRLQEPTHRQQPRQAQEPHKPQQPSSGPSLPKSRPNPWATPAVPSMQLESLEQSVGSMILRDNFPPMGSRYSAGEVGTAMASARPSSTVNDAVAKSQRSYAVPTSWSQSGGLRPPPGLGDSNWPLLGPAGQDFTHHPQGGPRAPIIPAMPPVAGAGRGNTPVHQPDGRPGRDFLGSDSFCLWEKE